MGFSMNKPNMNITYGGESNKQQKSNLMKDNPVAKHASAMNMYGKHDSPAQQAKPDYIDLDGDGDTSEPMKKAAKEKSPASMKGKAKSPGSMALQQKKETMAYKKGSYKH